MGRDLCMPTRFCVDDPELPQAKACHYCLGSRSATSEYVYVRLHGSLYCMSVCMYGKAELFHKPGFLKLKGCENVMVPMAISRSMLAPVRILLCVSLPQLVILVPQLSSPTRLSLSLSSAVVSTLPFFPSCAHLSLPILAIHESRHPLPQSHPFLPFLPSETTLFCLHVWSLLGLDFEIC